MGLKVHALHIASTYSATAIKMVHGKFITRNHRELQFPQVNVAAQNTEYPDALDHGGVDKGSRTLNLRVGNAMLYQLSYAHRCPAIYSLTG